MHRLSPNQIQKLLNQYLVADYEQPINGDIMKAVASRVTDPKTDVLLLPAVDMDDSGPYEIADPRHITALETYTPSWLQTPRLKRLAEIVSAQAVVQQTAEENGDLDGDAPPVPEKDEAELHDSLDIADPETNGDADADVDAKHGIMTNGDHEQVNGETQVTASALQAQEVS